MEKSEVQIHSTEPLGRLMADRAGHGGVFLVGGAAAAAGLLIALYFRSVGAEGAGTGIEVTRLRN